MATNDVYKAVERNLNLSEGRWIERKVENKADAHDDVFFPSFDAT